MNKWSIYQVIVVITLVISAIIFNQLDVDLHYQIGDSMGMVTSQLLVMIGFLFISGLMCLIFLFQTKKSQTFLQHPAWKKMLPIIFAWFTISFIALIIAFENDSFTELLNHRVSFYALLYYFTFLWQLLLITGVHKFADATTSAERQIEYSYLVNLALMVLLFFFV
ncbi:hypothetical protein [Allobacillus halotolerans]|uniref:Quinol:cytochrome C oxidoreductase n=1 Tax=Allobacillus halotolerans TaxID=570278 RepID=A0ABS6GSB2_9BACI|nr:hypothetical protein [Allobacillus halotolerans]MBU6081564.1 hypothetical protein [Allobacillus halotolerans]